MVVQASPMSRDSFWDVVGCLRVHSVGFADPRGGLDGFGGGLARVFPKESPGILPQPLRQRLQTPDSRVQTPDSRLQSPESRLQTSDSRLQTPGSRHVKTILS